MKTKFAILIGILYAALVLLIILTYRTMSGAEGQVFFVYFIPAVIIVVVGISLIRHIADSMINPLKELKKSIRKVTEGDLDHILDMDQAGEIGDVCEEFEKLRIKLKDDKEHRTNAERENRELISNISHDLKTPITAIKGYAEGILDGVVSNPEQLERYARTIYNKSNDMDILIDELTYYTKIDTNRMHYKYEKLSPSEFFADCVEDLGLDLESRGIVFTYDSDVKDDVIIIADVEQLKRVVSNIINNAIKYMDKTPGKLDIRLHDDGDFVRAEIEDNGKGIAPKDLVYIFDRFYRTDASRNSNTGGSGIGLSIAKKIIEDHGGRIWASSREGEGTTFTFIIRKYQEP